MPFFDYAETRTIGISATMENMSDLDIWPTGTQIAGRTLNYLDQSLKKPASGVEHPRLDLPLSVFTLSKEATFETNFDVRFIWRFTIRNGDNLPDGEKTYIVAYSLFVDYYGADRGVLWGPDNTDGQVSAWRTSGNVQRFYQELDSTIHLELETPISDLREGKKQNLEMPPGSAGAHGRLFDQVSGITIHDLDLIPRGNLGRHGYEVIANSSDDNEQEWLKNLFLEGLSKPAVGAEMPRTDIAVSAKAGSKPLSRMLTLYSRLIGEPQACGDRPCWIVAAVVAFRDDAGDLSVGRPMAFLVPDSRQSYRAMFRSIATDLLSDVLAELRRANH
jgi:hypothetical protein